MVLLFESLIEPSPGAVKDLKPSNGAIGALETVADTDSKLSLVIFYNGISTNTERESFDVESIFHMRRWGESQKRRQPYCKAMSPSRNSKADVGQQAEIVIEGIIRDGRHEEGMVESVCIERSGRCVVQ